LNSLQLTNEQELNYGYGPTSPVSRLYDRFGNDAYILMIGTGYDTCSSFHVAEYRWGAYPPMKMGCPWLDAAGDRIWKEYDDIDGDCDVFEEIGKELDASGNVSFGSIGNSTCRLIPLKTAVDTAIEFLNRTKGRSL